MHRIVFALGSLLISILSICLLASPGLAISYGGVEFPDGEISFTDAVVSYDPVVSGTGEPTSPYRGSFNALGVPDYSGSDTCATAADCTFVSLGDGGSITLQFTDNYLTGSGDTGYDLWIFEVGSDVEDTSVEISKDGSTWYDVGGVGGSISGIDIDAYTWGTTDLFAYVRLTDNTDEGSQTGATVGADIDAVGAISSYSPPSDPEPSAVPEPSTLLLLGSGLTGLALLRRRLNIHS